MKPGAPYEWVLRQNVTPTVHLIETSGADARDLTIYFWANGKPRTLKMRTPVDYKPFACIWLPVWDALSQCVVAPEKGLE